MAIQESDQVYFVSPEQVKEWFDSGDAIIIDVREKKEWEQGHIPGAVLLELSSFDPTKIPDSGQKHLVFHCRSGRRCGLAAEKMLENGFTGKIKRMEGGFLSWSEKGFKSIK